VRAAAGCLAPALQSAGLCLTSAAAKVRFLKLIEDLETAGPQDMHSGVVDQCVEIGFESEHTLFNHPEGIAHEPYEGATKHALDLGRAPNSNV
jgi:hypothetical protein